VKAEKKRGRPTSISVAGVGVIANVITHVAQTMPYPLSRTEIARTELIRTELTPHGAHPYGEEIRF